MIKSTTASEIERFGALVDPAPLWKLTDTEITTRMGGYKYSIELERIQTKRDVLMWVSHIAMKTWMTRQGIRQFAELLLNNRT